jgi:diguanylate cyclase (GGDEF)-like protein
VEAFLQILPTVREEAERVRVEPSRPAQDPPSGPMPRAARASKSTVFEDIAGAHTEIYALYQIAQTMGTSLGVADSMSHIAEKLSMLVPFSACSLYLRDEPTDTLRCRFSSGVDAELMRQLVLKSGQGLTGWVARNRRSLVNARPSTDLEAAGIPTPTTLQSALVCPLIFNEQVIGTLAVYHTTPGFYTDDHRRLLDRVCEQAAAVIKNAMLFEKTEQASLTDPLTGLPNTRYMVTHLTRELARAERLGADVSLIVMDVDEFKAINDTHGHHVGDRALREISQVLRSAIRPYDVCVRYAGDEFIIVLANCGADEAESKRTELQEAVADTAFEAKPGVPVALAISAGAAVFPHDGESYEALLAKADSRMYRDKVLRKREAKERPVPVAKPEGSSSETRAKAG